MLQYLNKNSSIQNKISEVKSIIMHNSKVRNPQIKSVVSELLEGGKYLRPTFFFLFSQLGTTTDNTKLTKIASSLEIMHMATLVHDDIIDDADLRHNKITIQKKWGKDIAVYTGDFLFTLFFELLIETMNGSKYLAVNAKAMKKILVGELDQMHLRYNTNQTILEYLRSVSGKTAALFRLASMEGAYFSNCSPKIINLSGKIGQDIGFAFQILDDILDYTANKKKFNKPVLEDLNSGVFSLPLIYALQNNFELKTFLKDKKSFTPSDIQLIKKAVIENNGITLAHDLAYKFTQKAILNIKKLPSSNTQKQLLKITRNLLNRTI